MLLQFLPSHSSAPPVHSSAWAHVLSAVSLADGAGGRYKFSHVVFPGGNRSAARLPFAEEIVLEELGAWSPQQQLIIVAAEGEHVFWSSPAGPSDAVRARVWGFGGASPGRTVAAVSGEPIDVQYINALPQGRHLFPVDREVVTAAPRAGEGLGRLSVHVHGGCVCAAAAQRTDSIDPPLEGSLLDSAACCPAGTFLIVVSLVYSFHNACGIALLRNSHHKETQQLVPPFFRFLRLPLTPPPPPPPRPPPGSTRLRPTATQTPGGPLRWRALLSRLTSSSPPRAGREAPEPLSAARGQSIRTRGGRRRSGCVTDSSS